MKKKFKDFLNIIKVKLEQLEVKVKLKQLSVKLKQLKVKLKQLVNPEQIKDRLKQLKVKLKQLAVKLEQLNHEPIGIILLLIGFSFIGANINIHIWEKNFPAYSEVKWQTTTNETGISITLDKVILMEDEILVYTTMNKVTTDAVLYSWQNMYINGKKLQGGLSGTYDHTDKNRQKAIFRFVLDHEIKPNENIKIEYIIEDLKYGNSNYETKLISGEWSWEFIAKASELSIETDIVDINQSFILPNDQVVTIDYLANNYINSKLYFTISETENDMEFIKFEIIDDSGNKLTSAHGTYFNEEGGYYAFDSIDLNRTSYITIIPYLMKDNIPFNDGFTVEF
ncbi:hypothetical protein AN640_01285 [Candidatus Epulonipiscium fishelsonii]|uniref:Uncharacterized protein n=1 Tax=Candidatus Epulonipiscium fishelsonii TaxID=77094 RepID=A0ACC8XFR8_9FIRM|nr:hypothetical protein AN640_01285 [Epulopiscium sp. SCG-D08WGA-EpuloA1]OON91771.1 MAG: hypothetical protein ATN32_10150 [Epulopiscium sp. AS2M-Bin002]